MRRRGLFKCSLLFCGLGMASFGLLGCLDPTGANSGSCSLASFAGPPTSGMELGIGLSQYGGASVAQPFIPNADGNVTSIAVQLHRVGTFDVNTQYITASIEANSNPDRIVANPDGFQLGTSSKLDISRISTSGSLVTFKTSQPVPVVKSQIYWIRLRVSYPVNGSRYVAWSAYDGTSSAYSVSGLALPAVYETSQGNTSFSSSLIGTNRFLLFNVGC